jgi:putative polyhydroxyalkanoate system protein
MPTIDIRHPHSLGKPGCRAAVDAVARKLSARFGLGDMIWNGDTLDFAGRGVEGSLTVGESEARVRIRLGAMLGLLRPAIEAKIRRRLSEYLG